MKNQISKSINTKQFVKFFLSLVSRQALSLGLTALLFSMPSLATAHPFENFVKKVQNQCRTLNCAELKSSLQKLNSSDYQELSDKIRLNLRQTAKELAYDRWPDTILEGPYESRMNIKLEEVAYVLKNDEVVGYRLTYSAIAIRTDRCHLKQGIEFCEAGRIRESGFSSDDFKSIFVDQHAKARYYLDESLSSMDSEELLRQESN